MLEAIARRIDAGFQALPDSTRWFETRFSRDWTVFLAIIAVTVITRASVFGDPNYHIDESYYFLVGQRMQAGDILYVDIWDRKPPGLYLIYRFLAEISHEFWIVHLAAAASAAATAFLIYCIALLVAARQGALLAAFSYLLLLPKFGGAGGQSPVFYNLTMALAAWLILSRTGPERSLRRELLAMFCAGLALTIKQTAIFEAALMGVWLAWRYRAAGGLWARTALLALCGGLPTIAYFAWFAVHGHFEILWQSVVSSNLSRNYDPESNHVLRLGILAGQISLPLGAAGLAIALSWQRVRNETEFRFLVIWTVTALISVLIIPNKFDFYMLPLFVPLTIVGSIFYGRRDFGLLVFSCSAVVFLVAGKCFEFDYNRQSRSEMTTLATAISSGGGEQSLLIYGEPVTLYTMTGIAPPLELAFPPHLYDQSQRDSGPFKTEQQLRNALSSKPTMVLIDVPLQLTIVNEDLNAMVASYVKGCIESQAFRLRNMYGRYYSLLYSRCGQ